MATLPLSWPFANPAYRVIFPGQNFGPSNNGAEPGLPYGSLNPIYPHFHRGIDYEVPEDTQLLAVDAGVVVKAGWDTTGYGNVVGINHGGLFSLYAHMHVIQVAEGDHVVRGQVLGLSDSTGLSSGPHLHFGLNIGGLWNDDGGWVDPAGHPAGSSVPYLSGAVNAAQAAAGTTAAPGGYVTMKQAVYYARQAGIPEPQLATAAAIAQAESGLRIDAHNHNAANPNGTDVCSRSGSDDYGLWQVNTCYNPQYTMASLTSDPLYNAKAMAALSSKGSNWKPWSTYSRDAQGNFIGYGLGVYGTYLTQAQQAVTGTPPGAVPFSASDGSSLVQGPAVPIQDVSPQLPPEKIALIPVTVDLTRLVQQPGQTAVAAINVGGPWLPVLDVSVTDTTYRTPASFTATLPLVVLNSADGQRMLDALDERARTQVIVAMGYVDDPARFNPAELPKVFTGIIDPPTVDYATRTVSLSGPDLSGIFSEPNATSSDLSQFANMTPGDIVKKIVTAHNIAGLTGMTVSVDPTAGTAGGIFGADAIKTRAGGLLEWDILTQLAQGEGCALWFSGTTLNFRRLPPEPAPVVLGHGPGAAPSLLLPPRFMKAHQSKRAYRIQAVSYNTKQGQLNVVDAMGTNHDAATVYQANYQPNLSHDNLQRKADDLQRTYLSSELQAVLTVIGTLIVGKGQGIILIPGSLSETAAVDARYMNRRRYYAVKTEIAYKKAAGANQDGAIKTTFTCTSLPPTAQVTGTAASVGF